MKISARNVLSGKVVKVTAGAVNDEVVIELSPGVQVTSIITHVSAERLGLVPGKQAYAIIKASDVMVGAD
jgi:molybdopterin-binding protein